jgi:hypothetical protein
MHINDIETKVMNQHGVEALVSSERPLYIGHWYRRESLDSSNALLSNLRSELSFVFVEITVGTDGKLLRPKVSKVQAVDDVGKRR